MFDQEFDQKIGAPVRGSMQRGFAFVVGLANIEALIHAQLQRFESLGFGTLRLFVAIADAGGEEQRVVAVLSDELGIGSGLRAKLAWWRRRRTGRHA